MRRGLFVFHLEIYANKALTPLSMRESVKKSPWEPAKAVVFCEENGIIKMGNL
ncbi:hypothetical protein ANACOL_00860 [Anaerotruncus colihominis DSM 17241]|uniref:Uncharacterized protein n=1 Tax=Anaerotruncus colihominis DSM 17241 TaxID=445972 RepID=B0P7X1_9FIRM|nr:hypothetical protein ANACOL_00860 [Anaerotruncus colihominis DSM 17241]